MAVLAVVVSNYVGGRLARYRTGADHQRIVMA
jgi:hypothetical protein